MQIHTMQIQSLSSTLHYPAEEEVGKRRQSDSLYKPEPRRIYMNYNILVVVGLMERISKSVMEYYIYVEM